MFVICLFRECDTRVAAGSNLSASLPRRTRVQDRAALARRSRYDRFRHGPHAETAAVRRRVPDRPERHPGRDPGRVQPEECGQDRSEVGREKQYLGGDRRGAGRTGEADRGDAGLRRQEARAEPRTVPSRNSRPRPRGEPHGRVPLRGVRRQQGPRTPRQAPRHVHGEAQARGERAGREADPE